MRRSRRRPVALVTAQPVGVSPAVAGNVAALVHGAHSPRAVEPVAAAIVESVLAAAPYLNDAKYAGAVAAYAVTQARLRLLDTFLGDKGLVNRKGRPWAAADYARQLERLSLEQARELGLTPRSHAALGRDVAGTGVDLARLWAGQQPDTTPPVAASKPDAPPQGDTVPDTPVAGSPVPESGDGGEL